MLSVCYFRCHTYLGTITIIFLNYLSYAHHEIMNLGTKMSNSLNLLAYYMDIEIIPNNIISVCGV